VWEGSVERNCEPMNKNPGHAASGMSLVMPPPGLCRVPWRADTTTYGRSGGSRFRVNRFVGIIKGPQGRRAMGQEAYIESARGHLHWHARVRVP